MPELSPNDVRAAVDAVYRAEAGQIRATLIRLLGGFERAEDALQDAFDAALRRWPAEGVPSNPRAWLISAGRFKAIDALRRRQRFDASHAHIAEMLYGDSPQALAASDELSDDRLRLIFTCCHPALPPDARAALTLREVCGLTTEEIARAFLTTASTIAQRIVRAKARIREERIPYQVPSTEELPERMSTVLAVIYLLFNEGYAASSGSSLTRVELSTEAIRLGRVLFEALPEAEVMGLLALMLLHEARRSARLTVEGDIVLLEQQDRSRWDAALIQEGVSLVERALGSRRFGAYTLQAAIAAIHAEARTPEETDWRQICLLYAALVRVQPSPVVELNRAAAIAMHEGPEAGLALIDQLQFRGELLNYSLLHAARADLYRRLGRAHEARAAYQQAHALTKSEPERRLFERRLRELG